MHMGTRDKEVLSANVRADRVDQIEEMTDRGEYDSRSAAVDDVLAAGLRRRTAPVTGVLPELGVDAAWHLSLVAVVTLVAGHTTTALAPGHSIRVALILVAVALGSVAVVELSRVATGESELGAALRRWRQ